MGGLGYAHFWLGQVEQGLQAGEEMVAYGRKQANIRSTALGRWILALNYLARGRFDLSGEQARLGAKVSADPYYRQICNIVLGSSLVLENRYQEAEIPLREVVDYCDQLGSERVGDPARIYLGAVTMLKGRMTQGLDLIEKTALRCQEEGRLLWLAMAEMALGRVFMMISLRSTPLSLRNVAKNLGFLAKNVPQAGRRAEKHLRRAIDLSKEMGSLYIASLASFDLGLYYRELNRPDQAGEYLAQAADGFSRFGADPLKDQVRAELAGLEKKAG
jgi:tetratricopeptide (TPR) repeat protein